MCSGLLLSACQAGKELVQEIPPESYPNFEEKLERRDDRRDSLRIKNAPAES